MMNSQKFLSTLIYEVFVNKARHIAVGLFAISLLLFLIHYFFEIKGLDAYSFYAFVSGLVMLMVFPVSAILFVIVEKLIAMSKHEK